MLLSLTISNVVLIERMTVEFGGDLCALTGETGAGKSILLDSLGLALGQRGDAGLVRAGADQAQVVVEFDVPLAHPVINFLKSQDIAPDTHLILRRTLTPDGRSRAFINDQPVSVGLLKSTGEYLVEIHGQFDTHNLLNAKYHRGLLDEYGVDAAQRKKLAQVWGDWSSARRAYEDAKALAEKARSEEEYLRAAVEMLDELSPQAGEEEKLTALRSRLMKREQIIGHLNTASSGLQDIETLMNTVWRAVEKTGQGNKTTLAALDRAAAEIREASAGVEDMSAEMENSEYSLPEIDDRLFALKTQARKFSCNIDDLAAKRDELAGQLDLIEHQDEMLSDLLKKSESAQKEFIAKAKDVSAARIKAAARMDKAVAKELPPLKLEKARFETRVETLPENEWGADGMDRVSFLVSTNPGAAPGALNKIASGGEMARFMLALKVVMAEVGTAGTLVFDEVDSGIGGATAAAVGERLARLSSRRQILVVTHSPQVAARAGHHYVVSKGGKNAVRTDVVQLPDAKRRQEEIARMLSGADITDEARAAAGKLLEASAA